MTKHEKFLQELRAPVLRAEKARKQTAARTKTISGTIPSQPRRNGSRSAPQTLDTILAEQKSIFDDLFGTSTEEDD